MIFIYKNNKIVYGFKHIWITFYNPQLHVDKKWHTALLSCCVKNVFCRFGICIIWRLQKSYAENPSLIILLSIKESKIYETFYRHQCTIYTALRFSEKKTRKNISHCQKIGGLFCFCSTYGMQGGSFWVCEVFRKNKMGGCYHAPW